eukprot:9823681-Heterocapsa_arctica.AAC.1
MPVALACAVCQHACTRRQARLGSFCVPTGALPQPRVAGFIGLMLPDPEAWVCNRATMDGSVAKIKQQTD